MEIKDKVVIITGASYGIGEAGARLLADRGARLVLAARSEDRLEALSREIPGSLAIPTDMLDLDAVRAMVYETKAHFGRVDALVNNAGQGYVSPLMEIDADSYERLFRLNVVAPLVAMQAAIPLMREQRGGAIVNVSSGTALMYRPGLAAYSSTKRALNGLSLTAREELSADNIAVSTIYPYVTATDFHRNAVRPETAAPAGMAAPPSGSVTEGRPPADTAEYVAEMILTALQEGGAEYYAHDWMKDWLRTK